MFVIFTDILSIVELVSKKEDANVTIIAKNIITKPQIIVGDYTYYDDPEDVYNFEKNVRDFKN